MMHCLPLNCVVYYTCILISILIVNATQLCLKSWNETMITIHCLVQKIQKWVNEWPVLWLRAQTAPPGPFVAEGTDCLTRPICGWGHRLPHQAHLWLRAQTVPPGPFVIADCLTLPICDWGCRLPHSAHLWLRVQTVSPSPFVIEGADCFTRPICGWWCRLPHQAHLGLRVQTAPLCPFVVADADCLT